jgi:hypothetical protein
MIFKCVFLLPSLEKLNTLSVTPELHTLAEESKKEIMEALSTAEPCGCGSSTQENLVQATILLLKEMSPASLAVVQAKVTGLLQAPR